MDTFDPASITIAGEYDCVPYESRPFPQSHPARTAAIARLFGLAPNGVERARVLELGCASGGNIIPMAAEFPEATFLGVDLSSRQINEGQRRIGELGLNNIALRQQSILDLSPGDGKFDYVICHGVYSWVPRAVRAAILRICAENLTDNGVAYVSYNVYPGWRLRGVLRDAMMFHKDDRAPGVAVTEVRAFLNHLAELTNPGTPYGQMLRQEVKAIASQDDYYITHEYLEHTNEPCYVAEFLRDAQLRGLTYLADSNLSISIAENFGTDAGQLLRHVSGNRLDRMEQYIDFLTGRTFRQSILVKSVQDPRIARSLDANNMMGLHVQANLKPSDIIQGSLSVIDLHSRRVALDNPAVHAALVNLGRAFPRTRTIEDLAREADAPLDMVRDTIFKLVVAGMADLRAAPISAAETVGEMPSVQPLVRNDALRGRRWTTNAAHEAVTLSPVTTVLLPLLDGTRTHDELTTEVAAREKADEIRFTKNGAFIEAPDEIAEAAKEHVGSALSGLLGAALLEA